MSLHTGWVGNQELLFNRSVPLARANLRRPGPDLPSLQDFEQNGYCVIRGVDSIMRAAELSEGVLGLARAEKSPALALLDGRVQLAKADLIPSRHCPDASETDHISLHFDMGYPVLPLQGSATVYLATCLYFPTTGTPSETRTRLLPLARLGTSAAMPSAELAEQRLVDYVRRHGDGWGSENTGRLACLGRLVDALRDRADLPYMREHRIAEWFNRDAAGAIGAGAEPERAFFKEAGFDLEGREDSVLLGPGDLLVIDNTRVAHGRSGRRGPEEIYQLLYGASRAEASEVDRLRAFLVRELTGSSSSGLLE